LPGGKGLRDINPRRLKRAEESLGTAVPDAQPEQAPRIRWTRGKNEKILILADHNSLLVQSEFPNSPIIRLTMMTFQNVEGIVASLPQPYDQS